MIVAKTNLCFITSQEMPPKSEKKHCSTQIPFILKQFQELSIKSYFLCKAYKNASSKTVNLLPY